MNTDQFTPEFHAAIARWWNALKLEFHTPKCPDCHKFHTVGICNKYIAKYPLDVAKELLALACQFMGFLILITAAVVILPGPVSLAIGHMFGIIEEKAAPIWLVSASTGAVAVATIGLAVWKFPKIFPELFPAPEPRERHSLVIEAENTLNELEAMIHQRSQKEGRK
jgi:hypothetical protein